MIELLGPFALGMLVGVLVIVGIYAWSRNEEFPTTPEPNPADQPDQYQIPWPATPNDPPDWEEPQAPAVVQIEEEPEEKSVEPTKQEPQPVRHTTPEERAELEMKRHERDIYLSKRRRGWAGSLPRTYHSDRRQDNARHEDSPCLHDTTNLMNPLHPLNPIHWTAHTDDSPNTDYSGGDCGGGGCSCD